MRTVTSTDARAHLSALLGEVERTGSAVTITKHGRPVAVLSAARPGRPRFGIMPQLAVPDDFDAPLCDTELSTWEGTTLDTR